MSPTRRANNPRTRRLMLLVGLPAIVALSFAAYFYWAAGLIRDNRARATQAFETRLEVKDLEATVLNMAALVEPSDVNASLGINTLDKALVALKAQATSINLRTDLDQQTRAQLRSIVDLTSRYKEGNAEQRELILRELVERTSELREATASNWVELDRYATYRREHIQSRVMAMLVLLGLMLLVSGMYIYQLNERRQQLLVETKLESERVRAVLDGTLESIFTINWNGVILNTNNSATRLFGYTEQALVNRDLATLLSSIEDRTRLLDALRQLRSSHQVGQTFRSNGVNALGEHFPVDLSVTPMHLDDEPHFVVTIADASERVRLEQMKTEFISTVSHELRTPLTSISGSLGLLAAGAAGPLDERAKKLVDIAKNNAERLVSLVSDILDVERIAAGQMPFKMQAVNLTDIARLACDDLEGYAQRYKVTLRFSAPPQPLMVMADRDRMLQVLINLIGNAVKFSPAGKKVRIHVIEGMARGTNSVVIQDDGPGIPKEMQKRIFERFAQVDSSDTRTKGGSGLGLSIVRELMVKMGGEVKVDSDPGHGSTFTAVLQSAPNDTERTPVTIDKSTSDNA